LADLSFMETKNRYFVSELVAQVGSLPALAAQVVNLTSDPECDLGKLSRATKLS